MNELIKHQQQIWQQPGRRAVVYSGSEPASERLRGTRWDWSVPAVGTGCGTTMFPLSLGCPPVLTSEGKEWIGKIIHSPADAEHFELPPMTQTCCGEVIEETRRLAETLPPGMRIRQADIQSPLGIAELMWDESFYFALIEKPDAVHHLLDKVTAFVIEFIEAQRSAAGERYIPAGWPPVWVPEVGTMIADDTLSLVSPEMHREFSVPYLNRISEACGGLYYHTCSLRPQYFQNIRQIRGIRGFNINAGNSCPTVQIIREFSGEFVFALHVCKDMHRQTDVLAWGEPQFADEADFLRYWLASANDRTAMSIALTDICQEAAAIEKIYDVFAEFGCTPDQHGFTR